MICRRMPSGIGKGHRAWGFSLIELLVAVFILGILIGLILPALQSAREASRRAECLSAFKQIGLALHNYESAHGLFPAIYSDSKPGGMGPASYGYSPFARMLSQLDQLSLYNHVNLTLGHAHPASIISNVTVATATISTLVCPSDPIIPMHGYGRVNYRFNTGTTPWIVPKFDYDSHWSGAFTMHRFYGVPHFPDGLSQTVAASERLQGDWSSSSRKKGGDYLLANYGLDSIDGNIGPTWISECTSSEQAFPLESRGGESWFFSGFHFTNYNHCLAPNSASWDCSFDSATEDLHNRTIHSGSFSATSYHPGGVNVLFMDGSAKFVSDGIELRLWRSISTRNGREVVSDF